MDQEPPLHRRRQRDHHQRRHRAIAARRERRCLGGLFVADGTLIIDADMPLFTWASVIDNDSGDASFVRGVNTDGQ